MATILIIDDNDTIREGLAITVKKLGHDPVTASNGMAGITAFKQKRADFVITDLKMEGGTGVDVLRGISAIDPDVPIMIITGFGTVETAVEAMKLGAFDFITKPIQSEVVKLKVARALEVCAAKRGARKADAQVEYHRAESDSKFAELVGGGEKMAVVRRTVEKVAASDTTVFINGESGTGKELIARAIHYNSLRADKPFVPVDCNSLSENLLESELFGHVKGAFTGAVANKKGMFEAADSGTLFLDEIGNFSMAIQGKLLRVLQEREFRAVGDTRLQPANFRLITATNKDLKAMVAAGTFRDDLYYRINIFPIHAPALRERKSDIPALAYHFLKIFSAELGKQVTEISAGALSALTNHDWPGNVRELENVIHRAAILTNDHMIRQAHLVDIVDPAAGHSSLAVPLTGDELKRLKKTAREKSVEEIERQFVLEALRRNDWNVTRSAEQTGMQRPNFQALMKKYAIRVRDTHEQAESGEAG